MISLHSIDIPLPKVRTAYAVKQDLPKDFMYGKFIGQPDKEVLMLW